MEYVINGKAYPVIGSTVMKNGTKVPVIDLKLMSDYQWQLGALRSRLEHPEHYVALGEDVDAAIARLRKWLEEHSEQEDKLI